MTKLPMTLIRIEVVGDRRPTTVNWSHDDELSHKKIIIIKSNKLVICRITFFKIIKYQIKISKSIIKFWYSYKYWIEYSPIIHGSTVPGKVSSRQMFVCYKFESNCVECDMRVLLMYSASDPWVFAKY